MGHNRERNRRTAILGALFFAAAVSALARPADPAPINLAKLDKEVFDRLQAKASDSVDLSLDSSVISVGARFLSGQGGDAAKLKRLIDGLKSITVRSFTFDKPGEYTAADVQKIRDLLKTPLWTRIVSAHNKQDGEDAEIYLMTGKPSTGNDKPGGLLIISTEPLELTVVHILGAVDLKDLDTLDEMELGIPKLGEKSK
jgi:hypothetical protein